eukprot:gene11995-13607_t
MQSLKNNIFKALPDEQLFDELNLENIHALNEQIKENREEGLKSLVIMDDVQRALKDNNVVKVFKEMVANQRHLNCSFIILLQNYFALDNKNAGIISDAAAGALYATGFGAPLATAVLAAGNTAGQVGGKVKRAGQDAQQGLNNLSNQVNKQSNLLSQKGLQAVASTKQQVINGANNAVAQANQTANNLKQGAINSANNALASAGAGFAVV